jgi:Zn-dependent peptidase ImmA (M78 family)
LSFPETRWDAIQQGEMVAQEERRRLGLGSTAIKDLVGLLEWQGVRAAFIPLPPDVSGLTVREEGVGYFAIINTSHSSFRKRFSLAHEHAHVLIDRAQLGQVSRHAMREELSELRANVFAAALLMPKDGVTQYISGLGKGRPSRNHAEVFDEGDQSLRVQARPIPGSQTLQLIEVVLLANHFRVSPTAALYRLYNLRLIPERSVSELRAQIDAGFAAKLSKTLGLTPYAIEDTGKAFRRRFLRLILEALRMAVISIGEYQELAELVGTPSGEARELAELAGGTG